MSGAAQCAIVAKIATVPNTPTTGRQSATRRITSHNPPISAAIALVSPKDPLTLPTNNSFVSSSFLRERPTLRFAPELGVVGGEDMVFFRTAHDDGLDIRFSASSLVVGHEPPERTTFGHQLRAKFWLGNTEYVTQAELGSGGRVRWLARSLKGVIDSTIRPFQRLVRREDPQFRYAVAMCARAIGNAAGALGVKLRHH